MSRDLWPTDRRLIDDGYRSLPFPFEEITLEQSGDGCDGRRSERPTAFRGPLVNGVLAILESAVLDGHKVIVGLAAGRGGEAARVVHQRSAQHSMIWVEGEERQDTWPVLIYTAELRQVPAGGEIVGHVDEVPHTCEATAPKPRVADVAEGVAVKVAVPINIDRELGTRRAPGT